MTEAQIVVNGVTLTTGQAMAVRCGLCELMVSTTDPGTDEHGVAMSKAYRARALEVLTLMHPAAAAATPQGAETP